MAHCKPSTMPLTSSGINNTHQSFQMRHVTLLQLKGLKSYQPSKFNVSVFLSKADFSFALGTVTFEPLDLEQIYIHHLKALMRGINASRGQGHGCRFTMCHASLKMALLLHKVGLVKRLMSTTVPESGISELKKVVFLVEIYFFFYLKQKKQQ